MLHVAQGSNSSEKFGIQSQAVMKTTGKKSMLGVCIHGHLYVYYVFISFYLQSLLIQFVPSYSRKRQLLECCPFRGHFKLLCG